MNIICFGQMNWDWCWTGKQHLMTRLAKRGHRVLYIDPQWNDGPKSFTESLKGIFPLWSKSGLREIDHSLFVYTYPYIPFLGWRICKARYHWILKRMINDIGFRESVVITMLPQTLPVIEALKPDKLIYYAIDEMTAFGGTLPEDKIRIREQEEKLITKSAMALSVSLRLLNRIKNLHPNAYLLPNAVDPHHYSPLKLSRITPHPCLPVKKGPVITFMGQIDERMDQPLITEIARSHPDWTVILCGRIKNNVDFSELKKLKNIIFTGYIHYEELPNVLKNTDVCIVPYLLNELTRACSPIKVYEYLATGKPVVATPLDGLQNCINVIRTAITAEEFIYNIESCINEDTEADRRERLHKAYEHSWDIRTDELESLLKKTFTITNLPKKNTGAKLKPDKKSNRSNHSIIHDTSVKPSLRLKLFLFGIRIAGNMFFMLRVICRFLTGSRPLLIKKILVARKGLLGDMILFLPTLQALRQQFPKSKIDLGLETNSQIQDLLKRNSNLNNIFSLNFFSKKMRHKIKDGLKLFTAGYDMTITGATYFIKDEAFFAGAPFRIGIEDGHPMQRLNNRNIPFDPTIHETDNNLKMVESIGQHIDAAQKIPIVKYADKKMIASTKDLLKKMGISRSMEVIVIHPGAQKQTRRWMPERFSELALRLLKKHQNVFIVFTGIKSEYASIEAIKNQIPPGFRKRTYNLSGKTSMSSFIGMMRRSAVVISNDTGAMHLARSCGAPLLALLGPENDSRWGPYPFGPGPAASLRYAVPCAPCVNQNCRRHYCLRCLSVDDVYNAAIEFLHKSRDIKGSEKFYPLQKTLIDYTWEDLARLGFDLPCVDVIIHQLPDDPSSLISNHQELNRLLNIIQNQSYPNISVIVCGPPRHVRKPDTNIPLIFLNAVYPDNISLWNAILHRSSSEFIASMIPGEKWNSHKISQDIAALIRNPQANLAASSPLTNNKPFYILPEKFIAGRTTIRRSFLDQQLEKNTGCSSTFEPNRLWENECVFLGHSLHIK